MSDLSILLDDATADAKKIVALETALAEAQWTKVENLSLIHI